MDITMTKFKVTSMYKCYSIPYYAVNLSTLTNVINAYSFEGFLTPYLLLEVILLTTPAISKAPLTI